MVHNVTLQQRTLNLQDLWLHGQDEFAAPLFARSIDELYVQIENRTPTPKDTAGEGLPKKLLKRAETIITTVETVARLVNLAESRARAAHTTFRSTEAIRMALAQLEVPIKQSTFYKYRDLYYQNHREKTELAAALRRKTLHKVTFNKAILHCVDTHIMRFYARNSPRLRPATVFRLMQETLRRTGGRWIDPERCGSSIPQLIVDELLDPKVPIQAILENVEKSPLLALTQLPSRAWFYKYLTWFEHLPEQGKTVFRRRYGTDAWEREFMVFDTFASQATFPLQYVFADHYLLDVFSVDDETRSQLDRLWFTAYFDAYTRSAIGISLEYAAPCIESIQGGLLHTIWPKTSHLEYGINLEWPCYGIPVRLFLDNAWAHHSFSLEDLAKQISRHGRYTAIELDFRPPHKARYGALIERFFGNLSGIIKEMLPGAIRSSNHADVQNAAKEACLLYRDIDRFLHQIILKYQHTPHSELDGMTPHQKWLEGLQSGFPQIPSRTPGVERLFWRANPQPRQIHSKGVCAFGWHYWSAELGSLPRKDIDGKPIPYTFRYKTSDITKLALFREGDWQVDVLAKERRLPDGSTQPVSLWERQMAKDLAGDQAVGTLDWSVILDDMKTTTKIRQAEKRQRRAQRARQGRNNTTGKPQLSLVPTELHRAGGQDYTNLVAGFSGRS